MEWTPGVDYDENDEDYEDYEPDENEENKHDVELDNEEYDHVDQDEIDEILAEPTDQDNNNVDGNNNADAEQMIMKIKKW